MGCRFQNAGITGLLATNDLTKVVHAQGLSMKASRLCASWSN